MAAPTNSGEWDMATEDFCLNLSPLPSPRWSPLCFPPSPSRPFLPSSNSSYSMVMQYQGSNQSMDNRPQNQEHDDIVDPALYLAGDSALLQQQQQLRQNGSEASDWRARGGIMRMNMLESQSNNHGFEESNMGSEESEEMMMTCFNFPPSPTDFPLYLPMPSVFFVSSEQEDVSLTLSCQHILEDKSGALHVLNGVERKEEIIDLLFVDFESYVGDKFGAWDQIVRAAGVVPEDMVSLLGNIAGHTDEREATLRRINWLEQQDDDIVDQPVFELVGMVQQLIQNKGGELDVMFGGGVNTINRLEFSDGQGSPTTPETLLICQANYSFRVWLRHGGQWAADAHCRCSRLNIGSFTTVEDAISAYELVMRWSGWEDLTSFPGLLENENISKLQLQLPPPTQELNPVEDLDWCAGTGSERTGERVMADQAQLNSGCLGKRKAKEKNLGGKRRNNKTNGVRITIPLEDISQTKGMRLKDVANHLGVSQSSLKYACREYGISRWPPRKLITQSHPTETSALVVQEGIPRLNSDTLPSDQAFAATVEKITTIIVKEILPPPFSPTARQERLDEDFGNVEAEAVGIRSGGTGQSEMEKGQLNSRYLGNEKMKEMTQEEREETRKLVELELQFLWKRSYRLRKCLLKMLQSILKLANPH